jgi:Family of unknown function (DUF6155)
MSLTDLKKELKKFDKNKLINLISELYKKHKPVKDFFDFYVQPDEKGLFEKYKTRVFEAFYPKRGFHLKLKDARQAISDFKKFAPSNYLLAELMLFYVECGVQFTNDFGDIDENFYLSMEKMFNQTLSLMKSEDLLDQFNNRAAKILTDTNGMGWGFFDTLCDIYYNYYEVIEDIEEKNNIPTGSKVIPLRKV